MLGAIDGPSSALLATADGDAVAVHGLTGADVPRVARQSRAAFAARTPGGPDPERAVDTVELTLGLRHTVIASVPVQVAHERELLDAHEVHRASSSSDKRGRQKSQKPSEAAT